MKVKNGEESKKPIIDESYFTMQNDSKAKKVDVDFDSDIWDSRYMLKEGEEDKWNGWLKPSYIPITVILILIILVVLLPLLDQKRDAANEEEIHNFLKTWDRCGNKCRMTVVETIPENLTYVDGSPQHMSVFEGWMRLIGLATERIDIASFYWTLRGSDIWEDPSDWQGETIFNELLAAGTERKIKIRIAQDNPSHYNPNLDTEELQNKGAAEVRSVNFQRLVGAGILHTKMMLIDNKHLYLGSANFDWRSLTQVKELGVIIYNCSCLADDMAKLFLIYWELGLPDSTIPAHWSNILDTDFNVTNPAKLNINDTATSVYLASSPPPLCTDSRTGDITAILDVIQKANKFIYVAVMDYFPLMLYSRSKQYWPVIDDALRRASLERGVTVRLLGSLWNHTRHDMVFFMKSLGALNNSYTAISMEVKLFVVPSFNKEQASIPFARVNHNKYMVTDNAGYIGTSNWSGDYFVNTGGIGIVVNQTVSSDNGSGPSNSSQPIREQLQAIFERDWFSQYAQPISDFR